MIGDSFSGVPSTLVEVFSDANVVLSDSSLS
jgi:hypothetical protein